MNWLSDQLLKVANNLGKKVGKAKNELTEGYKQSLKKADWSELEVKKGTEPFIDLFKKSDKIKIVAEIPGASQQDIEVGLYDSKTIQIYAPTLHKKYSTTIELPSDVKNNQATYIYKNGVLTINLETV